MASRRRLAVALGAAVAVSLATGTAFAHIEADPGEAPAGARTAITFNVPNECSGNSGTDRIRMQLPAGAVDPVAGEVDNFTPSIDGDTVTWEGGIISGQERVAFPLTLTLPDTPGEPAVFKTIQHCSDGDELAWIEVAPAGGAEPEFAAPAVALGASVSTVPTRVETTSPTTTAVSADDGGADEPSPSPEPEPSPDTATEVTLAATAAELEPDDATAADTAADVAGPTAGAGDESDSSAGLVVGIVAVVVVIGGARSSYFVAGRCRPLEHRRGVIRARSPRSRYLNTSERDSPTTDSRGQG